MHRDGRPNRIFATRTALDLWTSSFSCIEDTAIDGMMLLSTKHIVKPELFKNAHAQHSRRVSR